VSRFPDEDRAYFYHRAEVQIELAERAEHPDVVAAHMALAEQYLTLSDSDERLAESRATHDGLRPFLAA
jgi:sirohydrochlorin ferrochelatase